MIDNNLSSSDFLRSTLHVCVNISISSILLFVIFAFCLKIEKILSFTVGKGEIQNTVFLPIEMASCQTLINIVL